MVALRAWGRLGASSTALVALASVASAASSGSGSSFLFDGTNSDLAQQFRRLSEDGVTAKQLSIAKLPSSVSTRLSDAGVSFADLPGLAQRALLWDSGFVLALDGSLRQVYPLDGWSMAELAVPLEDFTNAGCTTLECEQRDGEVAYRNDLCTGEDMLTVARCVVEEIEDPDNAGSAMWATGGNNSMVPDMRLMAHFWTHEGEDYLVYAIHTLSVAEEPAHGKCPASGFSSVIIPCFPVSKYTGSTTLKEPKASAWVTEWLKEIEGTSISSASVSYRPDGTSSDLARQLRNQYDKGVKVDSVQLATVPDRLASRLKSLDVSFEDLPGILQRALLWDTGYVLTYKGEAKEVWVLPDRMGVDAPSMANLAVSRKEYKDARCTELKCPQPDNTFALANEFCNGVQMLGTAKCVIEDFVDDRKTHLAMWATGGDLDAGVPEIRLLEHRWDDGGTQNLVYGIHTQDEETEPLYSKCPADGVYGSLVVPCYPLSTMPFAMTDVKAEPTQSPWVDDWVTEVMKGTDTSGSGISMYVWVGIGGGALLLLVLGITVGCCIGRRRRKAADDRLDSPAGNNGGGRFGDDADGAGHGDDVGFGPGNHYQPYNHLSTPQYKGDADTGRPTATTSEDDGSNRRESAAVSTNRTSYNVDDLDSGGSNNGISRLLCDDPVLGKKRLPFESITFKRLLAKGAFGEVWVCEYASAYGPPEEVAVKRLMQDRKHKFDEIQEFAQEIQLSASLSHPNVVETIGVAWSTLDNLVLVMEYIAMGDLQSYLKKQGDLLSWASDKIHMAIGIARALAYLHGIQPPLIHRDLKSKNVLLTRKLLPKVIDFGVTRRRAEETMTAGVGTPYWTAPEVLNGERYTEQSDIYSFGVLLSELDTSQLPYYDAVGSNGVKMKPFQVLEGVMSGVLRPSFSHDCPPRVRQLGVACLQHDPSRRPSSQELVGILGG